MFKCQVCGRAFISETEMGAHLRIHGVNLFPEVLRLSGLVEKVMKENARLTKVVKELESRLRIIT